jgi:uncharacterized repeat protein (TIGR01451 family)
MNTGRIQPWSGAFVRPRGRTFAGLALAAGLVLASASPAIAGEEPSAATPTQSSSSAPATSAPATTTSAPAELPTQGQSPTSTVDTTSEAPSSTSDDLPAAEADEATPDTQTESAPAAPPADQPTEALVAASVDLQVSQYAPEAAAAGAPITWRLTVTNNGPGTASSYTLSDVIPSGVTDVSSAAVGCSTVGNTVTCTGGPLAAGASATVTITGTTPSPFTFPLVNTATVAADDGDVDANAGNNTSTVVTTTAAPAPSLGVVTVATLEDTNANGVGDLGESIGFTTTVSNTGNVTLFGLEVRHDGDTVVCADTVLSLDESTTCTVPDHVITAGEVAAGEVVTTTTATATAPSGADVTAPESRTNTPIYQPSPRLVLVKEADLNDSNANLVADLGETIDYTFTVTNVGNVPLSLLVIVDPSLGGVTCPRTSLAAHDVVVCTSDAPHVTSAQDIADRQVVNSAFARAKSPCCATVMSEVSVVNTPTVTDAPGIALDKRVELVDTNDNGVADLGELIKWTFLVVNNGSVQLTGVTVDDPTAGPVTCATTTLAVQAATMCEATTPHVVTEADILAGNVTNTAVATGETSGGEPVVSNPDSTVTPTAEPAPALTLTKAAALNDEDGDDLADPDETIDYTFVLTNTGNVTLTDVAVDDPKAGPVTCPVTTLAPGESVTCTAEPYTVTEEDIDAGIVRNVAVGSGQPAGGGDAVVTPPATAEVPVDEGGSGGGGAIGDAPSISLLKRASLADSDGDGLADAGEVVTYTFLVTNTGDTLLINVVVRDQAVGPVTCPQTTLQPGEQMTCSAAPYTVTEQDVDAGVVVNVATATGDLEGGGDSIESEPSRIIIPTDDDQFGNGDGSEAGTEVFFGRRVGGGPYADDLAYTGGPFNAAFGIMLLLLASGAALLVLNRRMGRQR